MTYIYRLLFTSLFIFNIGQAQELDKKINQHEQKLKTLEVQEKRLKAELEDLKLQRVRKDIKEYALPKLAPGEKLIEHSAFSLVYDEAHEQAKWVAHILVPEVSAGNVSRSNDFREDPMVSTGTAVEKDYFLKFEQENGDFEYDGFGYDRGHLAPSADFRWSQKALSESYFYSNMSPQVPELNRGTWAELESILRNYIYRHPKSQLYIVSGPVLHEGLPKIERSINQVSIPEQYFKVVLDLKYQRAIAFLMPNKKITVPIETLTVSIDEAEKISGLDFFANLPDKMEEVLESQNEAAIWLPLAEQDDIMPLDPETLPPGHFNTASAQSFAEFDPHSKINVCGTVVSTKLTGKGHVFLNLDKKFPKQIFTAAIWKDSRLNFSYEPHLELKGKCICVEGTVRMSNGTPTMELKGEEAVKIWKLE